MWVKGDWVKHFAVFSVRMECYSAPLGWFRIASFVRDIAPLRHFRVPGLLRFLLDYLPEVVCIKLNNFRDKCLGFGVSEGASVLHQFYCLGLNFLQDFLRTVVVVLDFPGPLTLARVLHRVISNLRIRLFLDIVLVSMPGCIIGSCNVFRRLDTHLIDDRRQLDKFFPVLGNNRLRRSYSILSLVRHLCHYTEVRSRLIFGLGVVARGGFQVFRGIQFFLEFFKLLE